jgi:hypothetical protein
MLKLAMPAAKKLFLQNWSRPPARLLANCQTGKNPDWWKAKQAAEISFNSKTEE